MRFQEFSKFIIKPHLFENKQQYQQIMDTMINGGVINQNMANDLLKEVKSFLKRADRIIWWLRWFRIAQTGDTIKSNIADVKDDTDKSEDEKTQEIARLENLFKKITKKDYDYYENSISIIRNFDDLFHIGRLEHWSAMFEQSPQVNQIEWEVNLLPNELQIKLIEAEEEWGKKQAREIEPEPDDKIIIDYGKYAWVKLDREYCETEGKALEHCGNMGTPEEGDRILSFRTKVDDKKQKPHLTFILDKNNYLGQMKGRRNQKPDDKYHPYIIDLLQKDFVKGIKGGGYLSQNNFSLSDLDEEQRKALISEKPTLITPEEAYRYAMEEGERTPELEEIIAKSPGRSAGMAYLYAVNVIKGRWPEAEDVIAKESYTSYIYARDVIGDRFPEGEEKIKQHPKYAYLYAKDVIGGRWPEGEEAIKRVDPFWERYVEFLENNNE